MKYSLYLFFSMVENEGIIAVHDSQWAHVLLIKETDLERIITNLNSAGPKTTPNKGYNYIKKFAIGTIDAADYDQNFEHHILPYQNLIPLSQNLNGEISKSFTCSKSCRVSFVDFSNKPDGNYAYIMIIQDEDTKFIVLKALTSLESAEIYNSLIEIFCLIGVPGTIKAHDKLKIKSILDELSYFNENFDSKVELPENEDDDDQDIQQLKNLVEDWMDRNNSNEWHNALYFVQFKNNCSYNASINSSPFDKLLKPNYEYVKARYTRYLLHKPQIIEKSRANETNNGSSVTAESKSDLEGENGGIDEFYLSIEPKSHEDLKYEDLDSLIQILDETNDGGLSRRDKAVANKHIVVYKRNTKLQGPTPNALVKLEPVNLEKSNNQMNWLCKLREINFVDNTENSEVNERLTNKNDERPSKGSEVGNSQDQLHVLEISSPSSEYSEFTNNAKTIRDQNNLAKTIRNELRNAPQDMPTTICLVCRKKKRTRGLLSNAGIGKPVRLRTSIIDRQKGHPNYILAVIVDITPDGEFRLGTRKGILKDSYPSSALMDCNHTFFTLNDIPKNKYIDFSEALQEQMKLREKDLMKCSCYRQYGYCNPKFSYHNQCSIHESFKDPFRT